MSEAQEQAVVIEYCAWRHIPIFHIPNGGSRHPAEAKNLKRQGVKAGVPDLFVPLARGTYHGLFLEMKTKEGRLSAKQKEWLTLLEREGYAACVGYGAEQAIELIEDYLKVASGHCARLTFLLWWRVRLQDSTTFATTRRLTFLLWWRVGLALRLGECILL